MICVSFGALPVVALLHSRTVKGAASLSKAILVALPSAETAAPLRQARARLLE